MNFNHKLNTIKVLITGGAGFIGSAIVPKLQIENYDVTIALGYILITIITSLFIKTKLVISGRTSPDRIGFPHNSLLNKGYKFLHKLLSKRVNGIIAQTQYAEEVYLKNYKCPIIVIPNFLRTIKPYNLERKNQIVTVGRCVSEKGQHFLIESFSKIKNKNWNLVIIGDGPKRIDLEKQVESLHLKDRVIFTGSQKDVDYYLSQSKIFAMTSVSEGFPNGIIEAMGNKLATVSFNCVAGPSDIIEHGKNGFLVEVGDIDTFSYYLDELIANEELLQKISNQAVLDSSRYDLEKIAVRYYNFLKQ